jgi:hypothetical protein
MKFAGFIAFLLTATAALAEEQAATAYTALRTVGKQKGQAVLNRVLELRGRNGMPQPAVWKIILAESESRGGVREIEVQRGKIISERTPTSHSTHGEAMDFSRLNLDSEGVFTIINRESEQRGQPFDRIDYALRSGSGGAPVWTADLYDGARGRVATIQIAADSGVILGQTRSNAPITSAPPPSDRDFVHGNPPPPPPRNGSANHPGPVAEGYSQPGEPFRGVGDFFHRLGNRMQRRGEQLENFFTGKTGSQANDR